ncbi:MAG: hydantoinase/oxoprolinase N-terminal domain-containing protein, partial [Candidatus Bathyarchaeia archaeon]
MDIGGTFTDLVAFNEKTGGIEVFKAPSTPKQPVLGML